MKTVHKIPLGDFTPGMWMLYNVLGAEPPKILHVGYQGNQPCLWVEVEAEGDYNAQQPSETVAFTGLNLMVIGTGHPVPRGAEHVGTLIEPGGKDRMGNCLPDGKFVWHVYMAR